MKGVLEIRERSVGTISSSFERREEGGSPVDGMVCSVGAFFQVKEIDNSFSKAVVLFWKRNFWINI